jgi:transcriptional regulator with XRE-family HTH domain
MRAKHQRYIMVRLKVKEVAEQKGFSMGKLSREADIDRNTVKKLYSDSRYSPTVDTLHRVARALGVTIADLIEETDD